MSLVKKMMCSIGVIIACSSCNASYFTIDISRKEGKVVYLIQGKPASLNSIKKRLGLEVDKDLTILVRVHETISIADIFEIFKLIKTAKFKEVILNARKTEDKNHFSHMHIPIQLKDIKFNIKDIPPPPVKDGGSDFPRKVKRFS